MSLAFIKLWISYYSSFDLFLNFAFGIKQKSLSYEVFILLHIVSSHYRLHFWILKILFCNLISFLIIKNLKCLGIDYFINLRTSEIHLFYNLQLFYWHFLEILWLFIFLVFYIRFLDYLCIRFHCLFSSSKESIFQFLNFLRFIFLYIYFSFFYKHNLFHQDSLLINILLPSIS